MLLGTIPHSSPKMSEMCEFVLRNKVTLAFIIDTWFQSFIAVSIIDIPGYPQSYVVTVRPIIMVAFASTSVLKFDTNDWTLFRAAPITRYYGFGYALDACRGGFPP